MFVNRANKNAPFFFGAGLAFLAMLGIMGVVREWGIKAKYIHDFCVGRDFISLNLGV